MYIRLPAALAAFLALGVPVHAHVMLDQPEAVPGQTYRGAFRVSHGCDQSPTIRVEATLPAALTSAAPLAKAGWQVEVKGSTIIWSGGSVPAGQNDEFVFQAAIAQDAALGPLPIPVIQTCEKGEFRWTETAAPGQDPHKLATPAPVLKLVQRISVGVQEPWLRATPKGAKVAGGFGTLVSTGGADRLLSASFPSIAGRTEIHEMAVSNGIMTMRPLPNGIEIPAGGTVEFKPGSFHLMLMDLKEPLLEGKDIEGTLVFEKAGPITVRFPVVAIGAPGPMQQHKH